MRPSTLRIALAVVSTAVAVSVSPAPMAGAAVASTGSPTARVLALTNAERRAHGCRALTWNDTLAAVAAAHSRDMAVRGYFGHVSPDGRSPSDRASNGGYRYSRLAENIAAGYPTPDSVVRAWMASPGHRANILNCSLTELGVGYATGGEYGSYWTQDFGTPR